MLDLFLAQFMYEFQVKLLVLIGVVFNEISRPFRFNFPAFINLEEKPDAAVTGTLRHHCGPALP